MKIKIKVNPFRGLYPERTNLGTVTENNATELVFLIPDELKSYARRLVFETSKGCFRYDFKDSFFLPLEVLTDEFFKLQLVLTDGGKIVWKSRPTSFRLHRSLDASGSNIFTELAEGKRREVAAALAANSNASEADYLGMTWDELLNAIENTDFLSDGDRERIEIYYMLIRKLYDFYEPYSITIDPIFPPGGEIIPGDD